jgi:hypothetical protein
VHAYLSIVAAFLIVLTNMERVYVVGQSLGFHAATIQALVRLVAGYTVDRARVTKAAAAARQRHGPCIRISIQFGLFLSVLTSVEKKCSTARHYCRPSGGSL